MCDGRFGQCGCDENKQTGERRKVGDDVVVKGPHCLSYAEGGVLESLGWDKNRVHGIANNGPECLAYLSMLAGKARCLRGRRRGQRKLRLF